MALPYFIPHFPIIASCIFTENQASPFTHIYSMIRNILGPFLAGFSGTTLG